MKKEFLFISLFFLLPATQFLKAQSDSLNKKFLRICSITIGFGPTINQAAAVGIEDYKKMAPLDSLTNIDMSPFKNSSLGLNTNGYFTAIIGFHHLNKKTNQYYKQREHRIGIRLYSNDLLQLNYDCSIKNTIDSFNYKGKEYYNVTIDSSSNFYYAVKRSNVLFDFGTIYHSNTDKLFSVYAGYNIGLGFSHGTFAYAYYLQNTTFTSKSTLNTLQYGPSKFENTTLNNSFTGSLNLCWGIDFCFGKTKKFWSRIGLNLELRSGWSGEYIQHYGTYIHSTLGGHFGLKLRI